MVCCTLRFPACSGVRSASPMLSPCARCLGPCARPIPPRPGMRVVGGVERWPLCALRTGAGNELLPSDLATPGVIPARSHALSPSPGPSLTPCCAPHRLQRAGIGDRPVSPVLTSISEICCALGLKQPKESTSFYSPTPSPPSFGEVTLVAIVSTSRSASAKTIELNVHSANASSIAFYERVGFAESSRTSGGTVLVMRRRR